MADLNEIMKERLTKTFAGETQEVTARRLSTTQGNVSKWKSGSQVPTPDMLLTISKAYKVSVDWLMGVSNEPEIDGLVLEKLTYEQIAKVFDRLIDNNTIEIPNLVDVVSENGLMAEPSEDGEPQEKDPIFDSDYIKVKDRLLAYIMRRRLRLKEIDLEMLDTWREKLGNFQGLRLLTYSDLLENAIDAHSPAQFKDGDWVELVNRLSKLTTDELQELVSQLKKKEGTN